MRLRLLLGTHDLVVRLSRREWHRKQIGRDGPRLLCALGLDHNRIIRDRDVLQFHLKDIRARALMVELGLGVRQIGERGIAVVLGRGVPHQIPLGSVQVAHVIRRSMVRHRPGLSCSSSFHGNLDRDLASYRSWYEAGVISAGVIITKDRLRLLTLAREIWAEYQATLPEATRTNRLPIDLTTSTVTAFDKAQMRLRRGVMGTCPVLIVAASERTWDGQPYR